MSKIKMPSAKDVGFSTFVPFPKFEDYSEKYKDNIIMERRDGVIMLRMHTHNKPIVWEAVIHRSIHQALNEVNQDPENHVMILTATGDWWVAYGPAADASNVHKEDNHAVRMRATKDIYMGDGMPIQENLIAMKIPTIGAINGSGYHHEMALHCDLTICTEDTVMMDVHRWMGFTSGDGMSCAFKEFMGTKRANYAMLMGNPITAKQALEWGMVNEVVPRANIYDRAWELGKELMRGGKEAWFYRRLMVEIMRKPLKMRFANDFSSEFINEMLGYMVDDRIGHHDDALEKMWENSGKELPDWFTIPEHKD
ncbi:MAG: enoyl-CoA hydratase/isomerase family protein [Desulfatitalea sp.]|nr:enoyl-CoA hydratase/isomerase family protein [Desulfatitalea sp.]NNK02501.1 enoyl-CoA hydratase/isomerase family protein [Desulfatitalea sp.]